MAFPTQQLLQGSAYYYVTRPLPILFTLTFSEWEGCTICCSLLCMIYLDRINFVIVTIQKVVASLTMLLFKSSIVWYKRIFFYVIFRNQARSFHILCLYTISLFLQSRQIYFVIIYNQLYRLAM